MIGTISSLRGPSYQIPYSLRFRSSASAYLSRTPASAGNRTTWTWSGWVKRGSLGSLQHLMSTLNTQEGRFGFAADDSFTITAYGAPAEGYYAASNEKFRDPSAWYHVVVVYNSTNPTVAHRQRVYVNNSELTWASPTLITTSGLQSAINSTTAHSISRYVTGASYFDGYLAEVNFVDGQALAPAAFGQISPATGVWSPKKYTGTYGTNGFYLKFNDNSAATSAAIGKDYSGNYNSWTPTNISLVAGSTYDSMTDTPTPAGESSLYFAGTRYPYNALNFRSSASTYLSRAFGTPTNQNVYTLSFWMKVGSPGTRMQPFAAGSSNRLEFELEVTTGQFKVGDATTVFAKTSNTFLDASRWYHVVVAANGSGSAMTIYVDGVAATLTTSNNLTTSYWNANGTTGYIGGLVSFSSYYFNGILADVNFVDGQALAPAAFGETVNGTWRPKTYTGTYGTNGFYLKFNDNSGTTATTMGKDAAGSNNWTPTNLATTDVTSTEITSTTLVNPSYGLQFRSSASAYLSRTPASAGNRKTWTWSGWVKRGALGSGTLFDATNPGPNLYHMVRFIGTDQINFVLDNTSHLTTTDAYRDTSAWYHIVAVWNTTNDTAADRMIMYVNGVRQTLTITAYTYPAKDLDGHVNGTYAHSIGRYIYVGTDYFNGYMAEVNFIDGQALTPAAFGETNSSGVWVPKTYTGTYGTNGFYLNFANRSAMTPSTIGDDASSNNNQWTPNNMAISDAIDYGDREARGNYAALSPIDKYFSDGGISNGNLSMTSSNWNNTRSSFGVSSGKWYWETAHTVYNQTYQGIANGATIFGNNTLGSFATGYNAAYFETAQKRVNGVISAYGSSLAIGDIVGFALDMDAGTLTCYKNNESQGVMVSGLTGVMHPAFSTANGMVLNVNFGQRPFAYAPPTGFKALCTQNLSVPTIKKPAAYMAATTYTGTGVGRTITNTVNNTSFQPDLVWIKGRSGATDHALYDSVRGTTKDLVSNSTAAETTQSTGLTAFGANGFDIGALAKLNTNAATYAAWQWKAGGSVVTNTAGSITSQVNADTTAGFSIVTYTGTGANATVGHGLGVVPKLLIARNRSVTANWGVYHASLGASDTQYMLLNTIGAINQAGALALWNNTVPTSTLVSLGTQATTNGSTNTHVLYCFAEVAGYSKFGSYTGNGSADGPFVHCNFRPRFVMIKRTDSTGNWILLDTTRSTFNAVDINLFADLSNAESNPAGAPIDTLSNGFKMRTNGPGYNATSGTYIYAAFAEVPSKYALAR